ncbi:MAG TPA: PIN domain-containing protein [bacterium]
MAAVRRPGDRGSAGSRERGTAERSSSPNVPQALERYRRVGLDTIVFIYHLSNHPLYAPITAGIFASIESGRISAVTSSLALIEILSRPKQLGHQAAVDSYRAALATFPHLELRRSDIAVTEQAADLRGRYRLAIPEAIQLATAIVDGAEAFVGNAPALRGVREIDVVLLDDLRAAARSAANGSGRRAASSPFRTRA